MVQWIDFVFVLCTIATYEMRAYKINKHPRTPQSTSLAMISVGRIKRQRPFTSAAGLPETGRIGVRRPALAAIGTGVFRRGTPARRRLGSIKRCKLRKLISLMERRFWSRLAPTGPRSRSRVFFFFFFFFFWGGGVTGPLK